MISDALAIVLIQGALVVLLPVVWAALVRGWRVPVVTVLRCTVAVLLATLVLLAAWNQPAADDWHHAGLGRDGWWHAQATLYGGWSGRFTASAILTLPGAAGCPRLAAQVMPVVLLAALIASLSVLLRRLLPQVPASERWWGSATAVLAGLLSMPSLCHGLYWTAGAWNYVAAVPLLALGATCALSHGSWARIAAAVLGVLAAGISETAAAAALPVALLVAAMRWRRGERSWAWFAGGLLVGTVVVLVAPGNLVRSGEVARLAQSGPAADPALRLLAWARAVAVDGMRWLADPVVACGSLLATAAAWRWRRHAPALAGCRPYHALLVIAAGWLALAMAYVPSFAVLGHRPPWRGRDLACLIFLASAVTACVVWASAVRRPRRWWRILLLAWLAVFGIETASIASILGLDDRACFTRMGVAVAAIGLLGVVVATRWRGSVICRLAMVGLAGALLARPATIEVLRDAVDRGPRYHAVLAARHRQLESAPPGGSVIVPRICDEDRPPSLYYYDLGSAPDHWINRAWAGWYRMQTVRTRDDDPE